MRHRTAHASESFRAPLCTTSTKPKQPWNRDIQLMQICRDATYHTLKVIEPEVLTCCESSLQHNFLSKENQTKLESSLLRSLNVISTLDRISSDEVIAPPPPQRRYIPAVKLPEKPTMPQIPKARLSAEQEAKGKELMNRIQSIKDRHMREKLEHDAMQRDLIDDLADAEEKRNTLRKYFEKVNQEMAVARAGLDTVKDAQLIEIRGYVNPPDTVRKVLEAVLTVLNEPEAGNWTTMQHYIRQSDFIPSVRAVQDISNLEPKSLQRLRQLTSDPEFNTENARKASVACAPLVQWSHAMMHYYDVNTSARGLKDELERLDAEIEARQSEIQNAGRKLRLMERDVAEMTLEYDENYGPAALAKLNDKARFDATNAYRAAVADWRAKCNVIKEKHQALYAIPDSASSSRNASPPRPPRPLLTRTVQTVEETRARCQRLVDAIQATMEQLKGPHGNVLVVEKKMFPKPVPRPVSVNANKIVAVQVDTASSIRQQQLLEEEAENKKKNRTPHSAPWRHGAKWKFDTERRVPINEELLKRKEEEEAEKKQKEKEAADAAVASNIMNTHNNQQQQQQQMMMGAAYDPNNQQQQYGQQQNQFGGGGGYDQQQQQPFYQDPYSQQQNYQQPPPQQQQQNYDFGGGGGGGGFQQQQPAPQAQNNNFGFDQPASGGGGGGYDFGGGGNQGASGGSGGNQFSFM